MFVSCKKISKQRLLVQLANCCSKSRIPTKFYKQLKITSRITLTESRYIRLIINLIIRKSFLQIFVEISCKSTYQVSPQRVQYFIFNYIKQYIITKLQVKKKVKHNSFKLTISHIPILFYNNKIVYERTAIIPRRNVKIIILFSIKNSFG